MPGRGCPAERKALGLPEARIGAPRSTSGPQRRTRLLLVGDLPPPAHGQSIQFSLLCEQLPRYGFACRVVDIARKSASPWSRFSVARAFEMAAALGRVGIALLTGERRLYVILALSRVGLARDVLLIWMAWLAGCRIAAHVHSGGYGSFYRAQGGFGRWLIRRSLRRVARIVVNSEGLRATFAFDERLRARTVAIASGAVVPGPVPAPGRQAPAGRPLRLLFLSNMIVAKGYNEALDAVALLRQARLALPVRAVFAGRFVATPDDPVALSEAEAEARFRRRIDDHGLRDSACYDGEATGARKWQLLAASDVLLLPTRLAEASSIAILEAMAHGCVVIASKQGGIPETVVDGETGLLLDDPTPSAIAAAVRRVAADGVAFERMSRAAAKRFVRHFTSERHVAEMAAVLAAL